MKAIKKLKTKIMETLETVKTKVMKKEKKVKVTPTQEQLNKMMLDYLKSSSKHMFQTKYFWDKEYKDTCYKVFPATIDGKPHYVAITIDGDKVGIEIKDTSWVTTKNQFGMLKNRIFRQEMKHKSIKPSLEMKIKWEIIKKFIDSSIDLEVLKVEIKKILQ
jgi:hypothetical protein